jgi:hypothetical protein
MKRPKLPAREIWMLLFLYGRCGLTGRTTLKQRLRARVVPLWRRELVEIWWRQVADEGNRGPYFSLTVDGHHLACAILAARDDRRRSKSEGASVSQPLPPALAA